MMSAMASQITSVPIVYSTVCSGADQRTHQSSASLAFMRGIHRWPVNSPHKEPVTRKMFLFNDVIMLIITTTTSARPPHTIRKTSHPTPYHQLSLATKLIIYIYMYLYHISWYLLFFCRQSTLSLSILLGYLGSLYVDMECHQTNISTCCTQLPQTTFQTIHSRPYS